MLKDISLRRELEDERRGSSFRGRNGKNKVKYLAFFLYPNENERKDDYQDEKFRGYVERRCVFKPAYRTVVFKGNGGVSMEEFEGDEKENNEE